MDKEKQQEELAPLSRWQRYWWKRYNRYVPSLESRSMTPGEWSAEDERELLRWRLARFMEKQGTVEGYGKFNGEELLRRGEDRSSSDYP